jgi:hypothetical protein
MSLVFIAPVVFLVLLFAVSAVVYGWWRRRRVARIRGKKQQPADRPDATPRERFIGLSGSLREALADRFGPAYRARTIEELFVDSQLGDLLGAGPLERLTHFLVQVDQLKFAPERGARDQQALQLELAEWAPRVEAMTKQIRASAAGRGDQNKPFFRGRRRGQRD